MKKFSFIVIMALAIISCQNQKSENKDVKSENKIVSNDNALLYNNVTIKQEIDFYPEQNKEWKESLVKSDLLKKIYTGALNGKEVLSSLGENPMEIEDVKTAMGQSVDTTMIEDLETGKMEKKIIKNPMHPEQVTAIFFEENWYMDKNLTNFEKHIIKYSPVRKFVSEYQLDENNNPKKINHLIFTVANKDSGNFELVAENVISEFPFKQKYPKFVQGLNKKHLAELLVNSVLSGEKKAYSFEDFTKEMPIPELKTALGISVDTIMTEDLETGEFSQRIVENQLDIDDIIGVVFIEDWYFNKDNLSIKKKVKAIAPILRKEIISENGDYYMESKSLPFIVKI